MNDKADGRKLGAALCEVLGLDASQITYISVACSLNSPAVLTVRGRIAADNQDGFVETFTRYRIVDWAAS